MPYPSSWWSCRPATSARTSARWCRPCAARGVVDDVTLRGSTTSSKQYVTERRPTRIAWLLYLAGGLLAFEENRMGVHQILMVRPDHRGLSRTSRAAGRRRLGAILSSITLGRVLGTVRRAPRCPSRHDRSMTDYPWAAALTNLWVTAVVVAADVRRAPCSSPCGSAAAATTASTWCGARVSRSSPLVTLVLALGDGDLWRQVLITALTVVWGLRLAWHIARRNRGKAEDPRYVEMLETGARPPGRRAGRARSTSPQAVIMWFVSLPVQLGRTARRRRRAAPWSPCSACCLGRRVRLRDRRRRPARRVQGRPGQQGQGHGPRPVALHPPPQLLRRRRRLVGADAARAHHAGRVSIGSARPR